VAARAGGFGAGVLPGGADDAGVPAGYREKAVRQLTAAVVQPAVHVEIPESLAMADPARANAVFRCMQERLTNTKRHGEARDDGQGCGALVKGNGLRGMRERVEGCGGWLQVETATGAGFAYRIEMPLGEERV